jgi:hypothetical protein
VLLACCSNSTEPENSDELRLILTADKYTGTAPLTVHFSAKIVGNSEGLSGHLPDYIFYSGTGKTVIRYSISDTSQVFNPEFSSVKSYSSGEYKVFLLYQGIKDGSDFDLWSDTLMIRVN